MYKKEAKRDMHSSNKKICSTFKEEWLSELIEMDVVSSLDKEWVRIGDIFTYNAGAVVCTICSNANIQSEFSKRKKRKEWKLDYLKCWIVTFFVIKNFSRIKNRFTADFSLLLRCR